MIFDTVEGSITLAGSLVSVAADNLASHLIGGFKGSFVAKRPCRHCMVTYEELNEVVCSYCMN